MTDAQKRLNDALAALVAKIEHTYRHASEELRDYLIDLIVARARARARR